MGEADDGAGGKVLINRYDAAIAETENDASYVASMTSPKIPVVINERKTNAFGSPRGYKVQLNRPLLNLEPPGYERSKALGAPACLQVTPAPVHAVCCMCCMCCCYML